MIYPCLLLLNQTAVGKETVWQTPQVLPGASLIKPFSPNFGVQASFNNQ